jgi:multidrug/hemolysin transport system permease protein
MVEQALVKRHITNYLRDRWAVFFSFLSVLIILVLFLLFLKNAFGGEFAELPDANFVIHSWVLAGVLMVATVTVPLGFLGIMVRDLEEKAINDFYVSPVNRNLIVLSYLISAIIIGMVMSVFNLTVGLVYLAISFSYAPPVLTILALLGLLLLSNALFSAIFFFATTYIKTSNAHGTLSTLVGTLIGFLAGLYVVIGSLPKTTQTIMSALPTMQIASAFRIVYMEEALDRAFVNNQDMRDTYEHLLGINLTLGDTELSLFAIIIITIILLALFTALSFKRVNAFKK